MTGAASLPSLDSLCLAGLESAFNAETQLFDRQLRDGRWAPTSAPETATGSAICLIGLDRATVTVAALDPPRAVDALIERIARRRQNGAVGLAVWAAAVADGPAADGLAADETLRRCGIGDPARLLGRLTTMELAWLVTGLLHDRRRAGAEEAGASLLGRALDDLLARQERSGLMPHARGGSLIDGYLRRRIANFADQVYPLLAFALATLVLDAHRPRAAAQRLAERMVALQGPLGQWWWHYRSNDGGVVSRYPVYAVHQHAMAPMAFAALERAAGGDWSAVVDLGRRWLWDNEVGRSLVDEQAATIWRSVERVEGTVERFARRARYVASPHDDAGPTPALRVNRETRPYEWAWQLYSSAIARQAPARRHIV